MQSATEALERFWSNHHCWYVFVFVVYLVFLCYIGYYTYRCVHVVLTEKFTKKIQFCEMVFASLIFFFLFLSVSFALAFVLNQSMASNAVLVGLVTIAPSSLKFCLFHLLKISAEVKEKEDELNRKQSAG